MNEVDKTQLIIIPATQVRTYETATKNNKLLIDWITKQYKQGAEIASMCVGGLLMKRVKVEAAKKMLESTRKTVNEIMYEVGYSDAKAFRDVFSRVTGLSPLEYKLKYGKENRGLVV